MEDSSIQELLNDEIVREIENLSKIVPGSPEHSEATDNLAKLYKLRIDENKAEAEHAEKIDENTYDDQFKRAQLRSDEFGRWLRLGVDVAGIVLPLLFYGGWMKQGFKFEETGAITSLTFRNLIGKFRPTGR